jgi:hypothetical protein
MPHTFIALVIYLLAAYRLTILIVKDSIFNGVRDWIRDHGYKTQTQTDLRGEVHTRVTAINLFWSWLHDLISCEWCTSIWVGTVVVLLQHYQQSWFQYVCFALALSSVASVMSEKT